MKKKSSSGQMLLVAALAISLIIASTTAYVYEVGNSVTRASENSLKDFLLSIQIGSRHVVIGALANISQGEEQEILATNLEKWGSFVKMQYQFGTVVLNYATTNVSPYMSGVWMFWSESGFGVSSASVSFNLLLNSKEAVVQLPYKINVTTAMLIQGTCKDLEESLRWINITCNLFNDGKDALAESFTVYYKNLGEWHAASNCSIIDYGDGTYVVSFTASITSSPVEVSVLAVDMRNINVQANATCSQI